MIRFTFISDSTIKNKEGWMIDDIVASYVDPIHCIGGINEISMENEINIYPNPSNYAFTIETPTLSTIEISTIHGQRIKSLASTGTKTNIDVSEFPNGVYIVEVKTEKGIAVKKFIKE